MSPECMFILVHGISHCCSVLGHQNGDFHINVRAINVMLGTQMRELAVYPQDVVPEHPPDRSLPPDEQLEEAIHGNEALASVSPDNLTSDNDNSQPHTRKHFPSPSCAQKIQHKHLARALAVAQTATPCKILCGECMAGPCTGIPRLLLTCISPALPNRHLWPSV